MIFDSVAKVQEHRKRLSKGIIARATAEVRSETVEILVGMATCGIAAGAGDTITAISKEIERQKLKEVTVIPVGCIGYCHSEPLVQINIPGERPKLYGNVNVEQGRELVIALTEKRQPKVSTVEFDFERALVEVEDPKNAKKQFRIALRNCGLINPDSIDEYIACHGYEALGKVLAEKSPEAVIETIKTSGLRGRGGGGFSTGLKWELTRKAQTEGPKYIFCNADEGDPGAFMDRSILEGDPHSVIEAMTIAGYAVGAEIGIVYIRAEYPLAIKRLKNAITDATEYGFLGNNILGSEFNFKIELRYGAGAFVCGEETALINSAEGKRGEPRNKPPYPAENGYWGQPTCVNNVETFANIVPIIINGAAWFLTIGTERSKGTKVFALAGKVRNEGLIEVPMGTTLREIIYSIGGGIKDDRRFKAVQTGGPSGGVITEDYLDTVIDYETLKSIDSIMGSGGMIVMDDTNCMVNIAKFYLEFTQDESCGKCTPCRIGNKRLYELLEKITNGSAEIADIGRIEKLAKMIKDSSICGLGQTAPNPVLSTLKFFKNEYLEHIESNYCATNSCSGLRKYRIDLNSCIGCTACVKVCPVNCISGEPGKAHRIVEQDCIKCGACRKACKFGAVIKP